MNAELSKALREIKKASLDPLTDLVGLMDELKQLNNLCQCHLFILNARNTLNEPEEKNETQEG